MKIDGIPYRSIWLKDDGWSVGIIDQTRLPHEFRIERLTTLGDAAHAIKAMLVRGAPLIGATAAYGICLGLRADTGDAALENMSETLIATRPTAVNLRWAIRAMRELLLPLSEAERVSAAYEKAAQICDEDVAINSAIGDHGLEVFRQIWEAKGKTGKLNILTHCNAGWLATVDWGTALSPIYKAHDAGIPVHVWVDETRPRNQGAHLTCWELGKHGVDHTLIVDNVGGHLMQHGLVDLCITGTDRTTAAGDVCNKVGTYLKALAAKDNNVPFYVALPGPTIDWEFEDGVKDIPIEIRDGHEVDYIQGLDRTGAVSEVRILPEESGSANYAFDVTPARLVTGLITERGVAEASKEGLARLYGQSVYKAS
ncbi:S-methyl-5-thioribose-1-phosphate isomerase [Sneathiella chungangensis]|uniref:Methylthioribose-1-phosphate isomerase n=1 Tax=Sneathiella chungangensis TaxID=1418234 RepID=A0A845MED8_9PROT|nr:S-methyl-5-thioribose-1-phosphate isomerase [Sneathiella chungangensis]MZR22433.1 S-methyl-5-thioribose-1-phosphate isomerase [Sneathiella chungangensis]